MFLPTRDNYTEMTPTEFEKVVLSELKSQFTSQSVSDYSFEHNVVENVYDGSYQIDGEIKFISMGVEFKILVECKHYKNPVKREQIQALYDKIRALGAHKGIFVTTSSFQSGAIKYATAHGIALISVIDGKLTYETRSFETHEPIYYPPDIPKYALILQTSEQENIISCSTLYSGSKALLEFITKKAVVI